MSRRTILAAVLVPVVTVLVGIVHPAPGSASQPPWNLPAWPGEPICAEGSLAPAPRPANEPARVPLNVVLRPCAGTDPAMVAAARWGVAKYYSPGPYATSYGYVSRGSIHEFPAGELTGQSYGFADGQLTSPLWGVAYAACIVDGVFTRIACVSVEQGADGAVVVQPIPADDGRVQQFVWIMSEQSSDPECAACV
jgi:hypothetical protein